MEEQFMFGEEQQQQAGGRKEEYVGFFENGAGVEDGGSRGMSNITPQAILVRSSLSNVNSPAFGGPRADGTPDGGPGSKRGESSNAETSHYNGAASMSMSPAMFTPMGAGGSGGLQRLPNSTPGAAPSPQQILSQRATPQAAYGDLQDEVKVGGSEAAFGDRALFGAMGGRAPEDGDEGPQLGAGVAPMVTPHLPMEPSQPHALPQQAPTPHQPQQPAQKRMHMLQQLHEEQKNYSYVDRQPSIMQQQPHMMQQLPQQRPRMQQLPLQGQSETPKPAGSSPMVVPVNHRQLLQNLDPSIQKRVSQDLNSKQYELFVKSFMEHCKRCNIPFNPNPEIGGTRVNLFILYMLVQRMGGADNITRLQQWRGLAEKLQVYAENGDEELSKYYYATLTSYEKYLMTPDGIKETQSKRLLLQQCLQDTLRVLQQERLNKQAQQSPAVQQVQPPQPPPTHQPHQSQNPGRAPFTGQPQIQRPLQLTPIVQQMIPPHHPSQLQSLSDAQRAKQLKPRKPRVKKKSKKEQEEEKRQQESMQRMREIQLEKQRREQKIMLEEQLREQQELLRRRKEEQMRKLPKVYKRSFARSYVPIRRPIESQNGYDIKALAQLGEKIDAVKPIFLFAPELGTINLHAITMSLQSENNCEINTALNTLLVTSADNILKVPLRDTPELLDTLCILACEKLHKLYKGDFHRKVTQDGVQKEYVVDDLLLKAQESLNPIDQTMDQILQIYRKQYDEGEKNVTVKVDSLTGIDISQFPITPTESPLDVGPDEEDLTPVKFEPPKLKRWSYIIEPMRLQGMRKDDELSVVPYVAALRMVKDEVDTLFTKCHKRGSEDPQVLLVDQIATISMIIRNLSFDDSNATIMANNIYVNRYIFELLWVLFTQMKKFVLHRKVLNLKKDTIIILSNLSHLLKLDNVIDGCLLLFLVLSFVEPSPSKGDGCGLPYASYVAKVEKYRCYGVDVISKIMSLGYPNRTYISSILLSRFEEETTEAKVCTQLLRRYNGQHKCKLFNDIFSMVASTIPLKHLNQMPNLVEESVAVILQALTASIALLKFINPTEEFPFTERNLPYMWLTAEDGFGPSIRRLGEALSSMGSQNPNLKHLRPIFNLIGPKCVELVRLLVEKSMQIASFEPTQEKRLEVAKGIMSIANLFPTEATAITIMMNPASDSGMAFEMGRLYHLKKEILSKYRY
ncbi:AFR455Wp [Eremothecium gossypii ATCC 10895]|uniref:AFR455Wp n=1 Tax=Eremothecium gossypii (strain ATCC 10895 / CBS 109.51 / FGSC 9923 / NRRL Y-1056) TaxID=284811 RepID=Q752W8_EREGS|nr:AFR455Wp [Eremothecium gossypii ATCC 10895]AAS53826.1 AFR455Wp [Eremothecium gossypii ATCC 10895]